MAKHLGISGGALSNYKYDGTLKRGVHWVQQTTGHRRVFYNKDVILEWWTSTNPSKTDRSPQNGTAGKKRIVSVYLYDDLAEKLASIQEESQITVKKEIDGIVMEVTEEKPKLNTIVNMLLVRAINDHIADRAA
ncbi:MAG: hypothetical protein DWQ28_08115 [Proteobacteria bacterium]|nr:MAG: hypothetical protein DWQ28_08115 [Pseudomonadota bacterium]